MLFVDDCIDAVLRLAVAPEAADNVFNIGSGEISTIADMAKQGIEVSGRSDVEYTDLEQNIDFSPRAIMADITKVTSTIDWRPRVTLAEGLKQMWDSYTN
jgi:UDP-glucose 4-epimerase